MREVTCTLEGFKKKLPKGEVMFAIGKWGFFLPHFIGEPISLATSLKQDVSLLKTPLTSLNMISIWGSKFDTQCTIQSSSNTTSKGLHSPPPCAPLTVYKPPFGCEMSNIKSSKVWGWGFEGPKKVIWLLVNTYSCIKFCMFI
jgi:hypothetical protein